MAKGFCRNICGCTQGLTLAKKEMAVYLTLPVIRGIQVDDFMEPPATAAVTSANATPTDKDTVKHEHIVSASAEKVRVMSNDDRIKLMNLFKNGQITEDEIVQRVGSKSVVCGYPFFFSLIAVILCLLTPQRTFPCALTYIAYSALVTSVRLIGKRL